MVHVPYKGGAPAMTDLVGGSIQSIFSPLIESLPFIKSGAIRALAVCGVKRSPLLPAVPPIGDVLPGYQSTSWSGIFAPAKTPPDIVNRMNAAMVKVLNQPNVRTHFAEADKEMAAARRRNSRSSSRPTARDCGAQVKISGAKAE
jgi:tripartite-type tricarboxylate transporter receptor subunit TctC